MNEFLLSVVEFGMNRMGRHRMKGKVQLVVVVLLLSAGFQSALAAPVDRYGASSRAAAMGGAMIGIASGAEATYHNSSALALSPNTTQIGLYNFAGDLVLNENDSGPEGIGFSLGLSHRILWERLGLGLYVGMMPSASGFDGGGLPLPIGGISTPSWSMYGSSLPADFAVGWGFRILDQLAVGGLAMQKPAVITTSAFPVLVDPILQMVIGLSTGAMPSNVSGFGFGVSDDPKDNFDYAGNVTFRPFKYLSLGFSYQPEDWTTVKVRARLIGGGGSVLEKDKWYLFEFKSPGPVETTTYGGAVHLPLWSNTLTLSWQHEDQNWDGHYGYSKDWSWDTGNKFSPDFFDIKVKDPGLKDIKLDRFGGELIMNAGSLMVGPLSSIQNPKLAVRGGFYHWDSPYPKYKYSWEMVGHDSDADVYSGGMGFSFDRNPKKRHPHKGVQRSVSIDTHFQYFKLEQWNTHAVLDEYGNQFFPYYINSEGEILTMGLNITFKY